MIEKISEHLYRFQDTCNVYVVKDGTHAVLIDFGSGRILDHLGDLGITTVDWILHTHHHRDQCQGAALANERHKFCIRRHAQRVPVEPGWPRIRPPRTPGEDRELL